MDLVPRSRELLMMLGVLILLLMIMTSYWLQPIWGQ